MKNMKAIGLILMLVTLSAYGQTVSPARVSTDAIINLPIAETWNLFTTTEGLQRMGYARTESALALGKHIHAEKTVCHDMEIIDATISSFDPPHMISWQWTSNHACWSVLYFSAMGNEMTQIKWVDMCYDAESIDLTKLALVHRDLFDQLIRRFAPECHVCKDEREAAEKQKSN